MPARALAAATNNHTLLDEVAISRAGLDHLEADALDAFATRVAARGATNLTVLVGTYGITMARTAFAPWVNKPRTALAERAGLTAAIPALVRQGKTLLRGQLDRLMNRYRVSNPAFFAAYRTARTVVDRHGAGGTPAGRISGTIRPPCARRRCSRMPRGRARRWISARSRWMRRRMRRSARCRA